MNDGTLPFRSLDPRSKTGAQRRDSAHHIDIGDQEEAQRLAGHVQRHGDGDAGKHRERRCNAPAPSIIAALQDAGAVIRAYPPESLGRAKPLLTNVALCDDPYACLKGAHAVGIVRQGTCCAGST